jgi:hypothetical protein
MTELAEASSSNATDTLMERLFTAVVDTVEVACVHLGGRLGFYRALAEADATPGELATRTGCAERYVREWLEQQAVEGFLTVDAPDADPSARRYHLPDGHRPVLVDDGDLSYFTPWAGIAIDVLHPFEQLLDAYRSGAGVPFEAYGPDLVDVIGAANRPQFVNLIGEWLASIPEIDTRLRAAPPARVADVACGTATPASSSLAPSRTRPCTPSASTPPRSNALAPMSPPPASPSGSGRTCTTPAPPTWAAPTTSSRFSRPCTT